VFKYGRETDTVKDIYNYVLHANIEDFQYFICHEVEDLTVVDGKDAKGLPVDVSTVVIKRCRKLFMIACGSFYHSCIASRQFLVELTELPVMVDLAFDFFDRSNQIFGIFVCFFIS
jgi:glucosamine 6-phosphate synthetase-like amidotransferase/phosphosugar isomerase protein